MALNGILTEAEVTQFIGAVCELRGVEPAPANPVGLTANDVADIRQGAADFIAKYGQPDERDEAEGIEVLTWRGVQRFKGDTRKDITLAEFCGRSAVIVE